ncbi:MAG: hypothetical protein R2744_12730 [Bacteroidales bacterium]
MPGKNVNINLGVYFEDDSFLYFRYENDCKSIDESHLGRLFERSLPGR